MTRGRRSLHHCGRRLTGTVGGGPGIMFLKRVLTLSLTESNPSGLLPSATFCFRDASTLQLPLDSFVHQAN